MLVSLSVIRSIILPLPIEVQQLILLSSITHLELAYQASMIYQSPRVLFDIMTALSPYLFFDIFFTNGLHFKIVSPYTASPQFIRIEDVPKYIVFITFANIRRLTVDMSLIIKGHPFILCLIEDVKSIWLNGFDDFRGLKINKGWLSKVEKLHLITKVHLSRFMLLSENFTNLKILIIFMPVDFCEFNKLGECIDNIESVRVEIDGSIVPLIGSNVIQFLEKPNVFVNFSTLGPDALDIFPFSERATIDELELKNVCQIHQLKKFNATALFLLIYKLEQVRLENASVSIIECFSRVIRSADFSAMSNLTALILRHIRRIDLFSLQSFPDTIQHLCLGENLTLDESSINQIHLPARLERLDLGNPNQVTKHINLSRCSHLSAIFLRGKFSRVAPTDIFWKSMVCNTLILSLQISDHSSFGLTVQPKSGYVELNFFSGENKFLFCLHPTEDIINESAYERFSDKANLPLIHVHNTTATTHMFCHGVNNFAFQMPSVAGQIAAGGWPFDLSRYSVPKSLRCLDMGLVEYSEETAVGMFTGIYGPRPV